MVAVSDKEHRHLMGWCLTLPFYFVLGAFAALKAIKEMVISPFYWDKTEHGVTSCADVDITAAALNARQPQEPRP